MGTKAPDSTCAPLCRHHHDEFDGRRRVTNESIDPHAAFEARYAIDMRAVAAAHYTEYINGRKAKETPGRIKKITGITKSTTPPEG